MNRKQKENTAKLLYDITKLSFIGIFVAGIVTGNRINILYICIGFVICIISYLLALWLEKEE